MRFFKWIDERLEETIMVVLLAGISLSLLLQIVMRYVFNAALSWSEEFARYCFVWSTFVSIGYSVKKGTMLRIDVVVQYLPKSWRRWIDALVELFVLAFFGIMLYNAVFVVRRIAASGQSSPAMGLPMVVIYASLVVGFALAALRGVQKIAGYLRKGAEAGAINTGRM